MLFRHLCSHCATTNNNIVCKLTDFGLSRRVDPALEFVELPRGQPEVTWTDQEKRDLAPQWSASA